MIFKHFLTQYNCDLRVFCLSLQRVNNLLNNLFIMEVTFNYDQFRRYLNKNFSVEVSGKFKGAGSLSLHDASLLHHKMQRSSRHFSDGYRMHENVMTFRVAGKTIKLYYK